MPERIRTHTEFIRIAAAKPPPPAPNSGFAAGRARSLEAWGEVTSPARDAPRAGVLDEGLEAASSASVSSDGLPQTPSRTTSLPERHSSDAVSAVTSADALGFDSDDDMPPPPSPAPSQGSAISLMHLTPPSTPPPSLTSVSVPEEADPLSSSSDPNLSLTKKSFRRSQLLRNAVAKGPPPPSPDEVRNAKSAPSSSEKANAELSTHANGVSSSPRDRRQNISDGAPLPTQSPSRTRYVTLDVFVVSGGRSHVIFDRLKVFRQQSFAFCTDMPGMKSIA